MIGKILNAMKDIAGIVLLAAVVGLIVLSAAGNRFYIVQSGSMEPAIMTGDIVTVNTKADYEDVAVGDVICFESANHSLVIHRCMAKTEEGIETKGDHNKTGDGVTTTISNFRGKVVWRLPYLGYLTAFLNGRKGRILIGMIIAVIVIISIFRRLEEKESAEAPGSDRPEKPVGEARD